MRPLVIACLSLTAVSAVDQPGGANSPPPSAPLAVAMSLVEVDAGGFVVRVPDGTWTAPDGGVSGYAVPGPIVAVRGADGQWRGHSYLEVLSPVASVTVQRIRAEPPATDARTVTYQFADKTTYRVTLIAGGGRMQIDETADLGPRNAWIFDGFYNWQPTAGLAIDGAAVNARCLFMPCYYDKPEVTIRPADLAAGGTGKPGGMAIVGRDRDVIGVWVSSAGMWQGADTFGMQLWQRRQLPGDPASRHFLGPDTKSDSTPNPRTAPLLGTSLYEGHITMEFTIGSGRRILGFAAVAAGAGDDLAKPFLAAATAGGAK